MQGFLYLLPFILLSWFGLSYFFKSAGYAQWKAFVPIYNVIIWLKIIKKPTWWVALTFIPVVNIVLFIGMVVELLNSFGIRTKVQHVIAAVLPYLYLPYLGMKTELNYTGPVDYSTQKKGEAREWSEALFFAIIAATAIRAFMFEAFVIPTGSMERTLRVYDCLFVNKMSYGTRFTMTPLAVPFSHQTIMGTSIKSYSDLIELPYFRFPGFEDIDNGDMVVFNYPQEDYHPIDKRTHYIKRCVGIAGDSLEIVDGKIKINGSDFQNSDTYQVSYTVAIKSGVDYESIFEAYQISPSDRNGTPHDGTTVFDFAIGDDLAKELSKEKAVISVTKNVLQPGRPTQVFDKTKTEEWTMDNFGPIYIPSEGDEITVTNDNFHQYYRLINNYEGGEIHSVASLSEMKTNVELLVAKMKQVNVEQLFVNGNIDYRSSRGGQGYFGQMMSFTTTLRDNFITSNVPAGLMSIADPYYWKDNANFSDSDMKNLAKEYVSFVNANAESQIAKLNDLEASIGGDETMFLINGELTNKYKVKQNYYFMIGDNRHRSGDSRSWGYVPENHVVGKPVFVWMSLDDTKSGMGLDKIRWDRVCSFVSTDGISRSYKIEVLILILAWTAFNRFYWKPRKQKKKNNAAA